MHKCKHFSCWANNGNNTCCSSDYRNTPSCAYPYKTKSKKKYTKMFSKKQLRAFVRPMFSSTIQMGHATPEQVEAYLDKVFGVKSRLK